MTTPWSNGPIEGHINGLKAIKRQMYGRAGFELLSRCTQIADFEVCLYSSRGQSAGEAGIRDFGVAAGLRPAAAGAGQLGR